MKIVELTDKQRELLKFLKRFVADHGYPPSRQEIATAFNITPNAVQTRLLAMERRGAIHVIPNISRGIRCLA